MKIDINILYDTFTYCAHFYANIYLRCCIPNNVKNQNNNFF